MPPRTRSQAAEAAARRRDDLDARRTPAKASSSVRKSKAARGVRGNSKKKAVDASSNDVAAPLPPASCLCDDLLLEIFLRLPSLTTLVRTAFACATWQRAVASSSPDFRRRFRALHPPPLLGLFTTDRDSIISGSPTFVPARPLGRDLAAAVRGGAFLLTSLLIDSGDWQVISSSCRLGNLLLYNHKDNSLAVPNPLTRQTERRVPAEGYLFSCVMLSSSRVMLVDHKDEGSKMKATVYSMDDTGVCLAATPWVDIPAFDHLLYGMSVHLNGSVYCVVQNWGYTVSIDTATMELTAIELPQCVSRQSSSLRIGETEDGATCLVYSDGLDVGVLMHTRDADGIQKWVLDRVVSMDAELRRVRPAGQFGAQVCVLQVFAVRDGYAYLSTSVTVRDRYWLLLVLSNDEAGEAVSGQLQV